MLPWQNNRHIILIKFLSMLALLATCNKHKVGAAFSSDQVASEQSTESFTPEKQTHDKLDILLVIDESGSMNEEHQSLSTRLNDLLSAVSDINWQIAITTTNPMSCVLTIIDKNTPDYERIFTETINLQNLQASYKDFVLSNYYSSEQAIWGAMRGLRGDCIAARSYKTEKLPNSDLKHIPNLQEIIRESSGGFNSICQKKQKWVREGSMLAVLLITDEDHQCIHHHGCHITDFYFYLKSIRTPHATGRVYGLLNEHENQVFTSWKDESGESLFDYHESIHSPDYTKILTEISQNISAALKNNFTLKHTHDGGSAVVVVTTEDGEKQTLEEGQYSIEGNALSINITLPADTKEIKVTYSY